MSGLRAAGFPEDRVRDRARLGVAAVFPPDDQYGHAVFGARCDPPTGDPLDRARLVPPVFVPRRMEKLLELGREPSHLDVDLCTSIGGFAAPLPLYLSAFGSTQVAGDHALSATIQAARLGMPMVIGENVVSVNGYGRLDPVVEQTMLPRIRAYTETVPDGSGGVVVQQSTEDADTEVWNLVYTDPAAQPLLDSGRLGFELKVGQGAKPGLGGMTVVPRADATLLAEQYVLEEPRPGAGTVLRHGVPGTFTDEVLRQQIRLMRNNYPRARTWVKLHPGRDVQHAATTAWAAGADAVTVDGAEGGTGWAPTAVLDHVGLPLSACLDRLEPAGSCLLVSGRMWEGSRVAKCLALGARAAGLGRAALVAVDEDSGAGLTRLVESITAELRLLVSSLGQYAVGDLGPRDVWGTGVGGGHAG